MTEETPQTTNGTKKENTRGYTLTYNIAAGGAKTSRHRVAFNMGFNTIDEGSLESQTPCSY